MRTDANAQANQFFRAWLAALWEDLDVTSWQYAILITHMIGSPEVVSYWEDSG